MPWKTMKPDTQTLPAGRLFGPRYPRSAFAPIRAVTGGDQAVTSESLTARRAYDSVPHLGFDGCNADPDVDPVKKEVRMMLKEPHARAAWAGVHPDESHAARYLVT